MNKCRIVSDLIPLYIEDMLSEESREFVCEHLSECEDCRREMALLTEEMSSADEAVVSPPSDSGFKAAMKRVKSRFNILSYTLVIFFIILGFAWTDGETLMYNSLLMPIIGIFGYIVFGWRSVYKMPAIVLGIDLFASLLALVEMDALSALYWSFVYSIFVLVGVAIAFLIHFAFRREKKE